MKITNEYVQSLGRFYADTPKAVFAAIALSFANRLFAKLIGTELVDVLVNEWRVLNENGIVLQIPPKELLCPGQRVVPRDTGEPASARTPIVRTK